MERASSRRPREAALLLRGVGRSREAAELFERLSRTPMPRAPARRPSSSPTRPGPHCSPARPARALGSHSPASKRRWRPTSLLDKFTPTKRGSTSCSIWPGPICRRTACRRRRISWPRRASSKPMRPFLHQLWWLDLEARIALQESGPRRRCASSSDLESSPPKTGSSDGRLRAAFGQARSQQASGRSGRGSGDAPAGRGPARRAEPPGPLHEGTGDLHGDAPSRREPPRRAPSRRGPSAEALDVARHARSRVLRQLERSDRLASLAPDRRARWERLLTNTRRGAPLWRRERRTTGAARATGSGMSRPREGRRQKP